LDIERVAVEAGRLKFQVRPGVVSFWIESIHSWRLGFFDIAKIDIDWRKVRWGLPGGTSYNRFFSVSPLHSPEMNQLFRNRMIGCVLASDVDSRCATDGAKTAQSLNVA
jgi:hypothetical protein